MEKLWAMRFVFGVLESERKRSDAGGGDTAAEKLVCGEQVRLRTLG